MASSTGESERPFEVAMGAQAAEKALIAEAAASLVRSGDTIIIDVGSTMAALARALCDREELRDLVVVTNGLSVAQEFEPAIPRVTVVVTGGTLRPMQHSLVEPLGGAVLADLRVCTAFLGCNGIAPRPGVTNANLPEAAMKRLMIAASERRVVVADGSKVGRVDLVRFCDVGDIDLLITGPSADLAELGALRDQGLEVLHVGVTSQDADRDGGRVPGSQTGPRPSEPCPAGDGNSQRGEGYPLGEGRLAPATSLAFSS